MSYNCHKQPLPHKSLCYSLNIFPRFNGLKDCQPYSSDLNIDQEEPEHAVNTGEDPNTGDDPLGPGHRAHRLSPHWMADSNVPADRRGNTL